MALDHSALTEPVAIRKVVTGATVADNAVLVTPPAWAVSVDIVATDGAVRVAVEGTEGSALTHYVTVALASGYNLPLQANLQTKNAIPYYVSTGDTAHTVEFAYVPRGL